MGLNGFIFKKINENENIKTKKNPESFARLPNSTAIQPNLGENGLDWLFYLVGNFHDFFSYFQNIF